jgi:peptide/nickel transport system permease protein
MISAGARVEDNGIPAVETNDGSTVSPGSPIARSGIVSALGGSWKARTGLALLGGYVVIAIIGPAIAPYNPSAMGSAVMQSPSVSHLLGTTANGQDVLSELLVGTRTSLYVGFVAAIIATCIGVVIGITAGYVGRTTDEVLSGLSNVFLVIPSLPLVIVLAGYLPNKGSFSIILVISLTGWAWGARVLRAQTLALRSQDFLQAARATGESTVRIIFFEILPAEIPIIASGFLFTVIFAVITQASLAFLGLSDVTQWSWGTMLYWAENNGALSVNAWWWFVPPGLAIALLGMALALINFAIDEIVNPKLRSTGLQGSGASAIRGVPLDTPVAAFTPSVASNKEPCGRGREHSDQ